MTRSTPFKCWLISLSLLFLAVGCTAHGISHPHKEPSVFPPWPPGSPFAKMSPFAKVPPPFTQKSPGVPMPPGPMVSGNPFVLRNFSKVGTKDPAGQEYRTWERLPATLGSGVSFLKYKIEVGAMICPHIHAFAWELFCIEEGTIRGGVIDPAGKLVEAVLYEDDCAIVPPGLLHHSENIGKIPVRGHAGFSSDRPGTWRINTVMNNVPGRILRAAFQTNDKVVNVLKDKSHRLFEFKLDEKKN